MRRNRFMALGTVLGWGLLLGGLLYAQNAPAPATGGNGAARAGTNAGGIEAPLPPVTAPFRIHIVAQNIRGGYMLLATDLNHDGKTDIVALGMRNGSLVWFENPNWIPHVITSAKPEMVALDAADLDGDGIPEIALAYNFSTVPAKSIGTVAIFRHNGDPTKPWVLMRVIDNVPSTHRVKFANVDGKGHGTLVVAPIVNKNSPGFADPQHLPAPLYAYREENGWKRELITDQNRGVVHGLLAYDWFGKGRQDILTAGYSGVYVHRREKNGHWDRTLLTLGNPAPWPHGGASAVAVGKIGRKQFFATIEPFHGNMVVVYTQDGRGHYRRHVIDDALKNGHALTLVDVNRGGIPGIVAGGRGSKTDLFFYRAADKTGQTWTKTLMDDDMAASACVSADIKGTGRKTDVVCIDARPPFAVKWYEYVGK